MTTPLTPAQLVLWAGQQLAPASPQYNSSFTFELRGPLATDRFLRAYARLVEECDNLRTVFDVRGGDPRQRVLAHDPAPLEVHAWPGDADALDAELLRRGEHVFDLGHACVDAALYALAPDHHVFFLNQHHLVVDAWGVGVQYRRLAELYREGADAGATATQALPSFLEYRRQAPGTPPPLPHYWSEARSLTPPRLLGRTNPAGIAASHRVRVTLDRERMDALDRLIRRPDVRHWTDNLARFNVLGTLLVAYVHRISGERELAFGTPSANRSTPHERRLPGQLIEMLPLYADVQPGDTFLSLLARVRTSGNAYLMQARAGIARPQLATDYNVILNYITAEFGPFTPEIACRTRWRTVNHADPGHHLRLQVHDLDGSGRLTLEFDLNTAVFTAADRRRVPEQFLRLFDACCAEPETEIAAAAILGDAESAAILAAGRGEPRSHEPGNFLARFADQVNATPAAVAIEEADRTLTYRELDDRSGRLAAFLRGRLRSEGGLIGIHLPRSTDLLVAILATWKAKHAYVPLPTDVPAGRLEHILRETDCALLITDQDHYAGVERFRLPTVLADGDRRLVERQEPFAPGGGGGEGTAYVMYTSGSSGTPKGVEIGHAALANYLAFATERYATVPAPTFPLFTTIGFDLTVTSLFTPLCCGGRILIYPEPAPGTPDLSVLRVMEADRCDVVKLTPSHLALLRGRDYRTSRVRTLIVGGEQFAADLARDVAANFPPGLDIVNEYGPTEATVGCIEQSYRAADAQEAVPIGRPIPGTEALLLDDRRQLVPDGRPGELYLGGAGLARGYRNRPDLTAERFVAHPYRPGERLYRTGDRARRNRSGQLEFLGRNDRQTKWRGFRIELDEVEHVLTALPGIRAAAVELVDPTAWSHAPVDHYCTNCGLPANYPSASFDEEGVCQLCRGFAAYEEQAKAYFKTLDDFRAIFADRPSENGADYDCIMLLSGGKDSTYALGQLVEMGLKVLAFTLDNGYISPQALANIRRVAAELRVDVHVATTPAMNEIFVDSLQRYCNVCNGCFKTIYTLSTQVALAKNIPYIVTGLSRGQFFETRLTEELFWNGRAGDGIDAAILEARKVYHRANDAVKQLLDTSAFATDEVFDRVQFLDFYRYTDATLDEMYGYLDRRLPWVRPTDTGRSTNCLINQVGIYVHKKEKGYNNYAFPYSWDVRIGHKQRDAALEEINEEIDVDAVEKIMGEIGYRAGAADYDRRRLVAYYTGTEELTPQQIREQLARHLPDYSIPQLFVPLQEMPLTPSGKIDRQGLAALGARPATESVAFAAPEGEIEELLAGIWREVLNQDRIGRHDRFLDLGGHSLTAIRLSARISDTFDLNVPLHRVFELPTIALQGDYLEQTLIRLLAETDDEPRP